MSDIRLGIFLPRGMEGREDARAMLHRIEAAGLDHAGIADHVSFHTGWGQDGIVEAAMLAMLCDLPIYVGVYLLALRHPVLVARQLAQLEQRAPGRLTLGIGVGGEDRHEVEICGVDPATRGARTDECLEVLRGLMMGEALSYEGRFFSLDRARIVPAPGRPVPLVVGGRQPRALRRAGRLGDGWLGIWSTAEQYRERLASVHAAGDEAGRQGVAWDHGLQLWCGFGKSRDLARDAVASGMEELYRIPFERLERYSPYGTPEEVAAYLRPYVDARCRTFNIAACAATPEEGLEAAAEVRRLLRSWG